MSTSPKIVTQNSPDQSEKVARIRRAYVAPRIEDMLLRINEGRVEVCAITEGEPSWRAATVQERELFGEKIWEG